MTDTQHDKLPVLTLDGPVWVGPWVCDNHDFWTRWLLCRDPNHQFPTLNRIELWLQSNGAWRHTSAGTSVERCRPEGHPTPEAAQAACEAAIIAAWRNR